MLIHVMRTGERRNPIGKRLPRNAILAVGFGSTWLCVEAGEGFA